MSDTKKLRALQKAKRSTPPSVFPPNVLSPGFLPDHSSNQPLSTFAPAVFFNRKPLTRYGMPDTAQIEAKRAELSLQHQEEQAQQSLRRLKHQLRRILQQSAGIPCVDIPSETDHLEP